MHCSSEKGDAGHSERNSSQDALQEQASTGSTANKEPNGGSLARGNREKRTIHVAINMHA